MNRFVIPFILAGLAISYLIYASFHIISTSAPDFYVYYYAGRDFLHGINPYNDTSLYTLFTYPPVSLIFYATWALLPLALSQGLFIVLSGIAILVLPYVVMRAFKMNTSLILVTFATACFIYSFPTKFTLGMGQINAIAYLIIILGVHLRNKPVISSVLISIACILKPVLVLCLLIYVIRRDWSRLALIIFLGGTALVLSYLIVGSSTFIYYFDHIIPHLASVDGREIYYNQGLLGFISRITADSYQRSLYSTGGSVIILIITMWNCYKRNNLSYQFSLVLTTLVIIDTLSWQHHFIFLLYPILYLVMNSRKGIGLYSIGLAYILISINISTPFLYRVGPLSLVLSHGLCGAFIIWYTLAFGEYALKTRE